MKLKICGMVTVSPKEDFLNQLHRDLFQPTSIWYYHDITKRKMSIKSRWPRFERFYSSRDAILKEGSMRSIILIYGNITVLFVFTKKWGCIPPCLVSRCSLDKRENYICCGWFFFLLHHNVLKGLSGRFWISKANESPNSTLTLNLT